MWTRSRQAPDASQNRNTATAARIIWYLASAPSPRQQPRAAHQRSCLLPTARHTSRALAAKKGISTTSWLKKCIRSL